MSLIQPSGWSQLGIKPHRLHGGFNRLGFESPSDCSFSIAASCPLPFFNIGAIQQSHHHLKNLEFTDSLSKLHDGTSAGENGHVLFFANALRN